MVEPLFCRLKEGSSYQIICFPYLGGHVNTYLNLVSQISIDAEIWVCNLPGRLKSTSELIYRMDELLKLVYTALQTLLRPGAFFFGHSMGGIISYYLVKAILDEHYSLPKPGALVLSACTTPQVNKKNKYSTLSESDLLNKMLTYGAISEDMIAQPDLMDYCLPIFRADFSILESVADFKNKRIQIPTYLFWGEEDKIATLKEMVRWQYYFDNVIYLHPIKHGKHMFVNEEYPSIAKKIEKIITSFDEKSSIAV
ncbi:MAG: thioesterase [Tatlockia sp.]|nr:thioesterase [Tatlockia sp.]